MSNPHYNYRGKIPFELYIELENEFPRLGNESDRDWIARVMREPRFNRYFASPQFGVMLRQAVHRRWMSLGGAKPVNKARSGPHLIAARNPNAKATIATRFKRELLNQDDTAKDQYRDEAMKLLIDDFDAATPADGSIFWNGVNELALARKVDQWNEEHKEEIFGQLEATTAVRYINRQFEWGPATEKYFNTVSGRLGEAAKGHVTAVCRCGLRNDSILTTTELPKMFDKMVAQIKRRETPTVTDFTIVVIEPKGLEHRRVRSFTNNELSMISIIARAQGARFINGPGDCVARGHLDIPLLLRNYWNDKKPGPSKAAKRIMADYEALIRF